MTDWHNLENKRLLLQETLDSQKSPLERNQLGQFATPTDLACDIVKYGLTQLPTDSKIRFLDPGIGTGSFYSALRKFTKVESIESAVGYEVDEHYAKPAKRLWKRHKLRISISDFTTANARNGSRANFVICNPPYVRHHHIDSEVKPQLQYSTEASCGIRLSGLSGLYCYFLGLSHKWMEDDAIAGWLIPSEFMDVNYGKEIKQYLLSKVTLLHIHRFDPTNSQFDDALVSSAIVWLKKSRPPKNHKVKFTFGGTLQNPTLSREVLPSELVTERKWTRYPKATKASKTNSIVLGDLFSVKRGLATGDNKFFIMERTEIEKRSLPFECFTPVLPSSRYLNKGIIYSDKDGLPKIDKQLFLLNTSLPQEKIQSLYPTLWEYLKTGLTGEKPVASRYLCKTRRVWYEQENRPPPPFLCTYMGRAADKEKPFRFFLNYSNATACNVYLLLYPKKELLELLFENPNMKMDIWKYLNSIEPNELISNGRVYGGGLYKLEPRELQSISAEKLIHKLTRKIKNTQQQLEFI